MNVLCYIHRWSIFSERGFFSMWDMKSEVESCWDAATWLPTLVGSLSLLLPFLVQSIWRRWPLSYVCARLCLVLVGQAKLTLKISACFYPFIPSFSSLIFVFSAYKNNRSWSQTSPLTWLISWICSSM